MSTDILPEHIRYKDVGCDLHSACLTCPLPVCKEEVTQGIKAIRAYMRSLQISLLRNEGHTVEWIAQVMGITARGVYKSVAAARKHELSALTATNGRDKLTTVAQRASTNGSSHAAR